MPRGRSRGTAPGARTAAAIRSRTGSNVRAPDPGRPRPPMRAPACRPSARSSRARSAAHWARRARSPRRTHGARRRAGSRRRAPRPWGSTSDRRPWRQTTDRPDARAGSRAFRHPLRAGRAGCRRSSGVSCRRSYETGVAATHHESFARDTGGVRCARCRTRMERGTAQGSIVAHGRWPRSRR